MRVKRLSILTIDHIRIVRVISVKCFVTTNPVLVAPRNPHKNKAPNGILIQFSNYSRVDSARARFRIKVDLRTARAIVTHGRDNNCGHDAKEDAQRWRGRGRKGRASIPEATRNSRVVSHDNCVSRARSLSKTFTHNEYVRFCIGFFWWSAFRLRASSRRWARCNRANANRILRDLQRKMRPRF